MTDIPLEHVTREPATPTDGPGPGLVVLHGRGADERDLLPVAEALPDELFVVSLRAPDPLGPGFTWYDLDLSAGGLHESQPDPDGFRRSLDLVEASAAGAVEAYDLDPDRLGFLGFSQGAITATALLLEAPGTVAWLAAHHGYLPASHADLAPEAVRGRPVLVAGGAADEVIPAERTEAAADRLREVGAEVTAETFPGGHGIGPDERAALTAFVADRLD